MLACSESKQHCPFTRACDLPQRLVTDPYHPSTKSAHCDNVRNAGMLPNTDLNQGTPRLQSPWQLQQTTCHKGLVTDQYRQAFCRWHQLRVHTVIMHSVQAGCLLCSLQCRLHQGTPQLQGSGCSAQSLQAALLWLLVQVDPARMCCPSMLTSPCHPLSLQPQKH